jgi:hypothetical protein
VTQARKIWRRTRIIEALMCVRQGGINEALFSPGVLLHSVLYTFNEITELVVVMKILIIERIPGICASFWQLIV